MRKGMMLLGMLAVLTGCHIPANPASGQGYGSSSPLSFYNTPQMQQSPYLQQQAYAEQLQQQQAYAQMQQQQAYLQQRQQPPAYAPQGGMPGAKVPCIQVSTHTPGGCTPDAFESGAFIRAYPCDAAKNVDWSSRTLCPSGTGQEGGMANQPQRYSYNGWSSAPPAPGVPNAEPSAPTPEPPRKKLVVTDKDGSKHVHPQGWLPCINAHDITFQSYTINNVCIKGDIHLPSKVELPPPAQAPQLPPITEPKGSADKTTEASAKSP